MVKVIVVVKVQGHIVGSATNRFASFHFTSIGPAIPETQLIKISPGKSKTKVMYGQGKNWWLHWRPSE